MTWYPIREGVRGSQCTTSFIASPITGVTNSLQIFSVFLQFFYLFDDLPSSLLLFALNRKVFTDLKWLNWRALLFFQSSDSGWLAIFFRLLTILRLMMSTTSRLWRCFWRRLRCGSSSGAVDPYWAIAPCGSMTMSLCSLLGWFDVTWCGITLMVIEDKLEGLIYHLLD